ncbi:uncharacterized protein LOC111692679 [Anoplophora glabripennis]|uniref:uncharacterized protein LOC111692679 n=1 Tax=Anoplophora glabripennis TaxID=217634 RepID=UPI000C772219|nr:uncharacterized protein LOC111692679 [Anoplophora glabripennis]
MDLYEEGIHNLVVDNNQILTVVVCPLENPSAGSTTTPLTSPTEMMTPTQTLKRKKDGKKNEKKGLEGQILEAFSNTSAQMDGVDGFLLRVGESLRKLPYKERAKLEIKIMQLLYVTEEKLNI